MSRLVFACRPDKADDTNVSVLLTIESEEEDGDDYISDLDQVGVGWLAIFDLEAFSFCFDERGKFFWRHCVKAGLSDL